MDWIDLAENRDQCKTFVNNIMNLRFPLNIRKFLSDRVTGDFLKNFQLRGVRLTCKEMCLYDKNSGCS
jgi:hypothetical protein